MHLVICVYLYLQVEHKHIYPHVFVQQPKDTQSYSFLMALCSHHPLFAWGQHPTWKHTSPKLHSPQRGKPSQSPVQEPLLSSSVA